ADRILRAWHAPLRGQGGNGTRMERLVRARPPEEARRDHRPGSFISSSSTRRRRPERALGEAEVCGGNRVHRVDGGRTYPASQHAGTPGGQESAAGSARKAPVTLMPSGSDNTMT